MQFNAASHRETSSSFCSGDKMLSASPSVGHRHDVRTLEFLLMFVVNVWSALGPFSPSSCPVTVLLKHHSEGRYSNVDVMTHTCYSSEFPDDHNLLPQRWEDQLEVVLNPMAGEGVSHDS